MRLSLCARLSLTTQEQKLVKQMQLLTSKPTLYIANVNEEGFEDNPHLNAVTELAAQENAQVVAICNKLEAEISELDDDERDEFLADLGMEEPGLDRVIRAGYELLGLHTYFTAGVKEVRAWTVKKAPQHPRALASFIPISKRFYPSRGGQL